MLCLCELIQFLSSYKFNQCYAVFSKYFILQVDEFLANEAKGTKIIGAKSLEDMVAKLKKPRKVVILVKGKTRS